MIYYFSTIRRKIEKYEVFLILWTIFDKLHLVESCIKLYILVEYLRVPVFRSPAEVL